MAELRIVVEKKMASKSTVEFKSILSHSKAGASKFRRAMLANSSSRHRVCKVAGKSSQKRTSVTLNSTSSSCHNSHEKTMKHYSRPKSKNFISRGRYLKIKQIDPPCPEPANRTFSTRIRSVAMMMCSMTKQFSNRLMRRLLPIADRLPPIPAISSLIARLTLIHLKDAFPDRRWST